MNTFVTIVLVFISVALVEFLERVTIGKNIRNTTRKRIISFYIILIILYSISDYMTGTRFYSRYFNHNICLMIYSFSFILCFIVLFYAIVISVRLLANNIKRRFSM